MAENKVRMVKIKVRTDQEHFKKAQQSNIHGYLIKPISRFTLESVIESTYRNFHKNLVSINLKTDRFYK